jgi:hypothetical protein
MNEKVIPFPFQRHVNFKNYMRKNKSLSKPKRKTKDDGYGGAIIYLSFKKE